MSKNDDKNTNVKDNCEKFINIYNDVFPEDVEIDPENIEDFKDMCLVNLRSEGKEFASLIQGVVKKPKSLKDKILKKRTEEQAVKSAILKIREFYSEDYKFIGKYGEAKREQTKEKVERSHLPTNNLMRLLTRLTDLKVQNIKSLYKLARESQLMHLTRSYSISGEGGLYLFPGSLLTDRVNMDPNWRNNDEHNKKLTFFNLSHILRLIAGNINADIVIIDQNPGATPLNQSLWSGSDYIIVPFEPSFFSSFSI